MGQAAEVPPTHFLSVQTGRVEGEIQRRGGVRSSVFQRDTPNGGNQVLLDCAGQEVNGSAGNPQVCVGVVQAWCARESGFQFTVGLQRGQGERATNLVADTSHQGGVVGQFQGHVGVHHVPVGQVQIGALGNEGGGNQPLVGSGEQRHGQAKIFPGQTNTIPRCQRRR